MKKFKISRGRKGKESDTASVASAVSQEGMYFSSHKTTTS